MNWHAKYREFPDILYQIRKAEDDKVIDIYFLSNSMFLYPHQTGGDCICKNTSPFDVNP